MKTNFDLHIGKNKEKGVILTHGLGGSLMKGGSLIKVQDFFRNNFEMTTLTFDMFGHGKSEGNMEDFNLSIVENQFQEAIEKLKQQGVKIIYIYSVSASSLPAIKAGLSNQEVNKIFCRVPAIEYYTNCNRKLGIKGMQNWKKNGKAQVGINYKTREPIIMKYDFIQDLLYNFTHLDFNSDTQIYLAGGVNDEEFFIDELRALSRRVENIHLWEFKGETHKFSIYAIEKFLKKLNVVLNL